VDLDLEKPRLALTVTPRLPAPSLRDLATSFAASTPLETARPEATAETAATRAFDVVVPISARRAVVFTASTTLLCALMLTPKLDDLESDVLFAVSVALAMVTVSPMRLTVPPAEAFSPERTPAPAMVSAPDVDPTPRFAPLVIVVRRLVVRPMWEAQKASEISRS